MVFEGADQARVVGRWAIDPGLIAATPDFLPLEGEGATARVFATGRTHRADPRQTSAGRRGARAVAVLGGRADPGRGPAVGGPRAR